MQFYHLLFACLHGGASSSEIGKANDIREINRHTLKILRFHWPSQLKFLCHFSTRKISNYQSFEKHCLLKKKYPPKHEYFFHRYMYLGSIRNKRASVFLFSSCSCSVLSATISSNCVEYFSIITTMFSITFEFLQVSKWWLWYYIYLTVYKCILLKTSVELILVTTMVCNMKVFLVYLIAVFKSLATNDWKTQQSF